MANHKVLVGIDYMGKRAEPGAIVSDIPSKSVPWLLEQGIIEPAEGKPKKPEPKLEEPTREPVSDIEGDE